MDIDHIARWYRLFEYAVFGTALERRRLEYLTAVRRSGDALVIGDGDGRYLSALAKRNCELNIDAIDLSAEMLSLTRKRLSRTFGQVPRRIRLECADIRNAALPRAHYDLIATHFFLDCLDSSQCSVVISQLAAAAKPEARWIISEFRYPPHGLRRFWAKFWIGLSYLFFRYATGLRANRIPEYSRALEANGFVKRKSRVSFTGMLVSELWERNQSS
jgi:SAM-dependent methyltransferase